MFFHFSEFPVSSYGKWRTIHLDWLEYYELLWLFFLWYICREIIRRKAVLALYKFYLIAPNQVQHIHNKFRKALCDKDPGVMTASLHIYLQMIQVIQVFFFLSCLNFLVLTWQKTMLIWSNVVHSTTVTFIVAFVTGESRRLQGFNSEFRHHPEAGGWRKVAHGF